MTENCYECETCKKMLEQYPKDKQKIESELEGIKISQTKEDMTLKAIHKRMDTHDKQEEVKRIELRADKKDYKKDRRNNTIILGSLLLSVLGSILGFGIWLSDITHNTSARLNTIERALGIDE